MSVRAKADERVNDMLDETESAVERLVEGASTTAIDAARRARKSAERGYSAAAGQLEGAAGRAGEEFGRRLTASRDTLYEGSRAVASAVEARPLGALLAAGLVGLAIGWLLRR